MNIACEIPDDLVNTPAVQPFVLYRDRVRPILEARRAELDGMYSPVKGRPELDPVFLTGVTLFQAMERMPDRQAVQACLFDLRWRLALGIPKDWKGFHPSTLVYFRKRVAHHRGGKWALNAGLEAMRAAGYLRTRGSVRIDSTHVLADLARLSRLECVRETLRLALDFLAAFGGSSAWEPWSERYADRNPKELRDPSVERLRSTMDQAGRDARDVLAKARRLGEPVAQSEPVALLGRVFDQQFQIADDTTTVQRPITPAGCVHNPHDPDAQWSTKKAMGKTGWVGYKVQICETAPEEKRGKGEPTEAVITAVLTQPAITSDHGSLVPALEAHSGSGQNHPETAFADAGYISAPALERADADGYELCGPVGAPPHSSKRFGSDSFMVDIPDRRATCPAGKANALCSRITEVKRGITYYYFAWAESDCACCPLKHQCLSQRPRSLFRTLQVGELHMIVQERRRLCTTPKYQQRMRRRNGIEGTNSECKRGYRLRRAWYRGLAKTDIQTQFVAAACNLRRWAVRRCWLARKGS